MEEGAVVTPEVLRSSANYKKSKTFDWRCALAIHSSCPTFPLMIYLGALDDESEISVLA